MTAVGAPTTPTPGSPAQASDWFGRLLPYRNSILLCSWVAGAMALAPSLYMLEVYGRVVNSRSTTTLWMLSLLVTAAFVAMELLEWLRSRMLMHAADTLERELAPRLFDAAAAARAANRGGTAGLAFQDLRAVRRIVNSPAVHGLLDAPVALLFLAAVFLISPWLGLFASAGALVQMLLTGGTERATHPLLKEANRESAASTQWAEETVRHAEVLSSMGMAHQLEARWLARHTRALDLQEQASRQAGSAAAASRWLQHVISSGLLGLGCWLLLTNSLNGDAGMMIVASILGGRVLAPLLQVITQWSSIVSARLAWQRLTALMEQFPQPAPALPLPSPTGQLSVEYVVAAVPAERPMPPVLKGLSFRLAAGEVLAVVGPSAAGKSTLARVVAGLWPTLQGVVRLDGFDLYRWNKAEVGRHLGYLPQDVMLLPGSIADNISRFQPSEAHQIEAAARMVDLHETILALPQGYATPVDDVSLLLSGGQRQRLALAGALFGSPRLVVLDEPNSSLDAVGDAALQGAIARLKSTGTTFVIITHRTHILEVADKILVLADGQSQAFGPRDEVLQAMSGGQQAPAGARQ